VAEVFINYRTGDGEWPAAFLDDKFKRRYGADRVFRDATSLEPGRDFREELKRRLKRSAVLVVVIGPDWLTARDNAGRRRLDSSTDYVRMEIAESLSRDIPVLPVTLNDVRLPLADELPPDIGELAYRQSCVFRSRNYQADFSEIVRIIDEEVPLATQNHDAENGRSTDHGSRTVNGSRNAIGMGDGSTTYYEGAS
jgi:TIR domain-containing protein